MDLCSAVLAGISSLPEECADKAVGWVSGWADAEASNSSPPVRGACNCVPIDGNDALLLATLLRSCVTAGGISKSKASVIAISSPTRLGGELDVAQLAKGSALNCDIQVVAT